MNTTSATRCKHCKKARGNHQAKTRMCPIGKKTRIGYIHYNDKQVFEPMEDKDGNNEFFLL